jgi:hypothetical protein
MYNFYSLLYMCVTESCPAIFRLLILPLSAVAIYFFKWAKLPKFAVYTCLRNIVLQRPDPAHDADPGNIFLWYFMFVIFYFVTGAGTMLRLRNCAVILSFRSLMRSRIDKVRFVNMFFACPVPHHKCGRRSSLFLSCLEYFLCIYFMPRLYMARPRLFAPVHFILF